MTMRPGFVVGLFFALTACAVNHAKESNPAWKLACEVGPYECRGVPIPQIVEAPLDPSLLGAFQWGKTYVLLQEGLPEPRRTIILAHEMIHYLQGVNGKRGRGSCANEKEAFEVSYEISVKLGTPDVQWTDIKAWYGCP